MTLALKKNNLLSVAASLVSESTGIKFDEKNEAMIRSRLLKRMLELGLSTEDQYCEYILAHPEAERGSLISLLTTHHTYFFREFHHFEFLQKTALPHLTAELRAKGEKTLRVWSAACSRGQEVYSLAMFLKEQLPQVAPGMDFEITGSDVDDASVAHARNGVYRWDEVKEIPKAYLSGNWMRGVGEISDFAKIKPELKAKCRFETGNLLRIKEQLRGRVFHIIFCRNVFIYFTPDVIEKISEELLRHLDPAGFFVLGLSESLNGLKLPVRHCGPSVYAHRNLSLVSQGGSTVAKIPSPAFVPQADASPVRVLCVDDSVTVLSLLKKMLSREQGFEVVGTAKSGREASEFLRNNRVDVVTLDIQMPEQNGIEYLERNMSASHPPVVMVSSISREETSLGIRSLELGASDYVQKPALAELEEKGEELRTKLRCALQSKRIPNVSIERSFQKTTKVTEPERKCRVLVCGVGDREKVAAILESLTGSQPRVLVLCHGPEDILAAFLAKRGITVPFEVKPAKALDSVRSQMSGIRTSMLVFGEVSPLMARRLSDWPGVQVIFEDMGKPNAGFLTVPYISFIYHSDEYLG